MKSRTLYRFKLVDVVRRNELDLRTLGEGTRLIKDQTAGPDAGT